MMKLRAFFSELSNRLTGGNPYRSDILGALLGALAASFFAGWKVAAIVALVSLLYRIWEGPSGKRWHYYAVKILLSALLVRLLLFFDAYSLSVFPGVYWVVFALLLAGYVRYARHFFLSAGFLFSLMLIALSGSEETMLITGALMGAVCGFFPKKREKEQKNVKFV